MLGFFLMWQGWRDSNSQHQDLESRALPIGATPLQNFNLTSKSLTAPILNIVTRNMWQGWRDSNSQHQDLESRALPIGATPLHNFEY